MKICLERAVEFEQAFHHLQKELQSAHPLETPTEFLALGETLTALIFMGEHGYLPKENEVLQEAETALYLLERVGFYLPETAENEYLCQVLTLSVGRWMAIHNTPLREIGLIVNAIASFANQTKCLRELENLYENSLYILSATDDFIKADLNKSDKLRPWRLLNLNHCIIATRTNNPEIIKSAYAQLVKNLPEEAPEFFQMACERAQSRQHPPHIRHLVEQYRSMYSTIASQIPVTTTALH